MKTTIKFTAWTLSLILLIGMLTLIPRTTEKTKIYDGFTVTEYRKHYFFDIHDGGMGRYRDKKLCVTKPAVCFRDERVGFSYPNHPQAAWLKVCDPVTHSWRFFDRKLGTEIICIDCDDRAKFCPKFPSFGYWFEHGNKISEISGNAISGTTEIRIFELGGEFVKLKMFDPIRSVVLGDLSINEWANYNDGLMFAWRQCSEKKCDLHWIDLVTGKAFHETTPCHFPQKITFVKIGNRPELRMEWGAKGDEICLNAEGKPAYPSVRDPGPWSPPPTDEDADKAPVDTPSLPASSGAKSSAVP